MNNSRFEWVPEFGTDLSSRQHAALIRKEILQAIEEDSLHPLVLDLGSVRSVSHSFADELFAVIADQHGEEWFRTHLKLINLAPTVRWSILEAIQHRQDICAQ